MVGKRSRTQLFTRVSKMSTSMGLLPVRAVVCQGSLERPVPSGAEDVTGLCERNTAILLTGRADRGVKARVNTPKERPSFWRQVLGLGRWHSHCPGFGVLVRGLWSATTCMEIAGVNARHSPVLKHGPRSLTCTRVCGWFKPYYSNKCKVKANSKVNVQVGNSTLS